MLLPGGILRGRERRREVRFRVPDGYLELAVAEASGESLPARVTDALVRALDDLGGAAPTRNDVAALCVADRQFLMHRVAEAVGLAAPWITAPCVACGERFDFTVCFRDLPVQVAGEGFPFAVVETHAGRLRLRTPTGADQEVLVSEDDPRAARRAIVARCVVDGEGQPPAVLSDDDIAQAEAALEAISPAVVTRVRAVCPTCGQDQPVELDPYVALSARPERTLEDVHALASAYHWSEREILSLPRARRLFYLACVDRAGGMTA